MVKQTSQALECTANLQ